MSNSLTALLYQLGRHLKAMPSDKLEDLRPASFAAAFAYTIIDCT